MKKAKLSLSFYIRVIALIVIGLLFLIFPHQTQNFILYIIGALLILSTIRPLVISIKHQLYKHQIFYTSILRLVAGILVMILNNFIIDIMPIIIGIYLIVISIISLIPLLTSINSESHSTFYKSNLITNIISLIIGILFIALNGVNIIGYLIGVYFIYLAIITILNAVILNKKGVNDVDTGGFTTIDLQADDEFLNSFSFKDKDSDQK